MKNKIGITLPEGIKQEVVRESLKVLASIEKKYNVKFEFQSEMGSSKLKIKMPKIRKNSDEDKGLFAFGGEMDL